MSFEAHPFLLFPIRTMYGWNSFEPYNFAQQVSPDLGFGWFASGDEREKFGAGLN